MNKELIESAIKMLEILREKDHRASFCWAFTYVFASLKYNIPLEDIIEKDEKTDIVDFSDGRSFVYENLIQFRPIDCKSSYWFDYEDFNTRINILKSLL